MQQDNPYYDDEDSLSGIDSDLIMGDPGEPPILKSLKHIGRSFREGGFCVAKKADKPKSIKVKPPIVIASTITETHCDSSSEDLASPLIVEETTTTTATTKDTEKVPKSTTLNAESKTSKGTDSEQQLINSPFLVLLLGILFQVHYPWGTFLRNDVEHLLCLFLFGFVVNYSLRSRYCQDAKEVGSDSIVSDKLNQNNSCYSACLRLSESKVKNLFECAWVGLICTLIGIGIAEKMSNDV